MIKTVVFISEIAWEKCVLYETYPVCSRCRPRVERFLSLFHLNYFVIYYLLESKFLKTHTTHSKMKQCHLYCKWGSENQRKPSDPHPKIPSR